MTRLMTMCVAVCAVVFSTAAFSTGAFAAPPTPPACDPDNGGLTLPPGFCALVVSNGAGEGARHIQVAQNGDIFVAMRNVGGRPGGIVALRDTNGDGRADVVERFGTNGATGLVLRNGYLYYATTTSIERFKMTPGELKPAGPAEVIVSGMHGDGGHADKDIAFDDRGNVYVNIGAPSQSCAELGEVNAVGVDPCPQLDDTGGIWRFKADVVGQHYARANRYATGMRQPVALAWHNGTLYAAMNNRDSLNTLYPGKFTAEDNAIRPLEPLLEIKQGDNFGWPYCWLDGQTNKLLLAPEYGGDGKAVGRCSQYKAPETGFPAHYAPLGLMPYSGTQFPEKYRSGLFMTSRGSHNRAPFPETGFNILYQPFAKGKVSGTFEVFADGFKGKEPLMSAADAVARPNGTAIGPDGSLYIAETIKGKIWRVVYRGGAAASAISAPVTAPATTSTALTGRVTSEKEGPMEGVLVSARADGSTMAFTVVSDDKGRYSFPASKVGPGHYTLKIRAVGYELDGAKTVDVAGATAATADITLRPTRNLASQLSNGEWMLSMPGTDAQKRFLYDCAVCHTLERVVRSTHNADEMAQVIRRMGLYSQGATPAHPQRQMGGAKRDPNAGGTLQATAEWLATTNLSASDTWAYTFKTLPRPKGRSTHVVMTEYDLPRKAAQPHDVIVDSKGIAWYSDFAEQIMGKLDPKTGKATEYPVPLLRPGFPTGGLETQFDKDENIWLSMMYQGGIAKFDRKTETVQAFPLPKDVLKDHTQESMVMPGSSHVDGKVWTNNQDDHTILRMDVKTGAWEVMGPFKVPGSNRTFSAYGMPADKDNNLYLLEYSGEDIARIDAKTKEFKFYPTPTRQTQPRRGGFDAQGNLWFAEFGSGGIGMFDPKTEKIQEWQLPTPWSSPYMALPDNKGGVWAASMLTDRVIRLDPKSGQVTEYLLPRETNVRRVFVDGSTTPPTFWVGNDHGASIVKVEPLD